MAAIITIEAARSWLRVGGEVSDADMTDLIGEATQKVVDFLGRPISGEGGWTDDTRPASVATAIKTAMVILYENRAGGPDMDGALRPIVGRYCRLSVG